MDMSQLKLQICDGEEQVGNVEIIYSKFSLFVW